MENILKKVFINRDYGLLFAGKLISQVGDGVYNFSLVWLVLDLTGSGTALGILLVISTIPGILLTPFSGVLADRFDRKKILILMDAARGLLLLVATFGYVFDFLNLWVIYLLTMLISVSGVFFGPAVLAVMPSLVPKEKLTEANSRDILATSATSVVGPIVGAFLLSLTGYIGIFLINGISFIVSAIANAFIRIPPHSPESMERHRGKDFIDTLKEGLIYIAREKGLAVLLFAGFVLFLLFYPLFMVVLPYFGKEVLKFSAAQYGFIQAGFSAGMLGGVGLAGFFAKKFKRTNVICFGIFVQSLLVVCLGIISAESIYITMPLLSVGVVLVISLMMMGFANVNIYVPFNVVVQEHVEESFRGRIFSLFSSATNIAVPLGTAMYGVLIDLIPLQGFLTIGGVLGVIVALWLFMSKSVRNLHRGVV